MLKCGTCGLGLHGCCFPAQNGRPRRRYYRCAGNDPLNSGRAEKCPRARIEADTLEQAVWDHVVDLLDDPDRLLAQFNQVAEEAAANPQGEATRSQLQSRLDRLHRADRRLLEAYRAEVISLEELSQQRKAIADQQRLVEQEREMQNQLCEQRLRARETLADLTSFVNRIRSRLQPRRPATGKPSSNS